MYAFQIVMYWPSSSGSVSVRRWKTGLPEGLNASTSSTFESSGCLRTAS